MYCVVHIVDLQIDLPSLTPPNPLTPLAPLTPLTPLTLLPPSPLLPPSHLYFPHTVVTLHTLINQRCTRTCLLAAVELYQILSTGYEYFSFIPKLTLFTNTHEHCVYIV